MPYDYTFDVTFKGCVTIQADTLREAAAILEKLDCVGSDDDLPEGLKTIEYSLTTDDLPGLAFVNGETIWPDTTHLIYLSSGRIVPVRRQGNTLYKRQDLVTEHKSEYYLDDDDRVMLHGEQVCAGLAEVHAFYTFNVNDKP